jgi:hypothetical protein
MPGLTPMSWLRGLSARPQLQPELGLGTPRGLDSPECRGGADHLLEAGSHLLGSPSGFPRLRLRIGSCPETDRRSPSPPFPCA